jgi:hypothetical protein
MSVFVAVTRAACNTGVGNQDFTTTDLRGLTPKAAYFIVSLATTNDTATAHAVFGTGAATATDARWSTVFSAEDGQASSDSSRDGSTTTCVTILDGNGAVDGAADFVSFITNGVRINWSNAPGAAYLMTVILFAGTDLSAACDVFTAAANENDTVDVNTIGFEPDLVLLVCPGLSSFASSGGNAYGAFGAAVNDGSDSQACWLFYDDNAETTTSVAAMISNAYGTGQHNAAGWIWAGEIGTFDSSGFSCTTRQGGAGTDQVGYLALSFGGAADVWLSTLATPTSTGNQSQTGPGFLPQFVMCGLTQMPALNTTTTDANAGSVGLGVFDGDDAYSTTAQDEDNQATSDCQCIVDTIPVNCPNDDGTTGHEASFVSFDSDGWTWNFTSTEGTAVYYWALAIEKFFYPRHPVAYYQTPAIY